MSQTYIGVIDRIVDDQTAAILLEEDDDVVDQLDVPVGELPEDSQEEGSVLEITVEDGDYVAGEYLAEETEKRKEVAQDRLDRLSQPLSDRKDE